ncbi:MAG: GNAT family N-acetyltransferase [Hyphomonadaceae bacterium]|nr:GNAT family N-acetyltransferase [Hyphomonadaceae bacterium]
MIAAPTVRLTRRDEARRVASVLADAFVDEAALNHWLKQGRAKERARAGFFKVAVEDAVHPERAIYLAERDGTPLGAAIWLSPGQHAFALSPARQVALLPRLMSVAGLAGMRRGFALAAKLEAYHPALPHAHLVFLGVAPHAQGQGVGSALLKDRLAVLDRTGTCAYLECSTERNVALYERHGFEVTGEFDLPGLHMWAMARAPRR